MTVDSRDELPGSDRIEVSEDDSSGESSPGGRDGSRFGLSPLLVSVFKSAGARFIALPMTAVLGVFSTRLIIQNFGSDTYAQYGLLVAIGTLLPFADLGMATAIMNAVGGSARPSDDEYVTRVLITSIRVLCSSGAVLVLASILITVTGIWPTLLGESQAANGGGLAAAGVLAVMGLTMPIAFGPRVLTGLGKNHITILLLGLQTPIVLATLIFIIKSGWLGIGSYLAVIPYVVILLLSVIATMLSARWLNPTVRNALRRVWRLRSEKGAQVFNVAWPTLIQMIVLPIAMQTDRLVLSHVTNGVGLAEYNLGSQMYSPVWQVVTAGGVALWPIFARHRTAGSQLQNSPMPLAVGFTTAATGACIFISIVSGWLARVASDGQITLSPGMLISFSLLMIFQAAKYPLGVYMTDPKGLRYQAFFMVFMIPVNLGLSIVLAQRYGAVGPVIGSAIGVFVCQVAPNYLYVRRDFRRLSQDSGGESASELTSV